MGRHAPLYGRQLRRRKSAAASFARPCGSSFAGSFGALLFLKVAYARCSTLTSGPPPQPCSLSPARPFARPRLHRSGLGEENNREHKAQEIKSTHSLAPWARAGWRMAGLHTRRRHTLEHKKNVAQVPGASRSCRATPTVGGGCGAPLRLDILRASWGSAVASMPLGNQCTVGSLLQRSKTLGALTLRARHLSHAVPPTRLRKRCGRPTPAPVSACFPSARLSRRSKSKLLLLPLPFLDSALPTCRRWLCRDSFRENSAAQTSPAKQPNEHDVLKSIQNTALGNCVFRSPHGSLAEMWLEASL